MGARFVVRLPVGAVDRPREPRRAADALRAGADVLAGKSIVVVDDDDDTRDILQAVLTAEGAIVRAASNAADAVQTCLDDPPDALISDIAMPGQDGYSLITELRERLGSHMPRATIALTAFAGPRDQRRAAEAGYRGHMSKPFDDRRLLQMLRDLLSQEGGSPTEESSLRTR
jgi:CheY-like chemotaxis protein